ncbi:MAG: hypothetical protein J1F10_02030 [Muribaculaceae bacterium]|nr:hypothetical protein [Muribaculaceae bacterium]
MKTTSYIIFGIIGFIIAFFAFSAFYTTFIYTPENRFQYINLTDNPVQTQLAGDVHTIRLVSPDESGMLSVDMRPFPGVWITQCDSVTETTVEYAKGWGDNLSCSLHDGVLSLEISTQFNSQNMTFMKGNPMPIKITIPNGLTTIDNQLEYWGNPSIMGVTADKLYITCRESNYFRNCHIKTVYVNHNDKPGDTHSGRYTFKFDTEIDTFYISSTSYEYISLFTDSTSVVRQMELRRPAGNVEINIEGDNLLNLSRVKI